MLVKFVNDTDKLYISTYIKEFVYSLTRYNVNYILTFKVFYSEQALKSFLVNSSSCFNIFEIFTKPNNSEIRNLINKYIMIIILLKLQLII